MPVLAAMHRVLAPDLLGFGYSDKRDRFDRSIARQTEMIDVWMKEVDIERASFIGHDIGGGVALRLAALFPQRVARLCAVNTVCYDSWPTEAMLQLGHPAARRKLSAAATLSLLRLAVTRGFAASPDDQVLDGLLAPYTTEVGKLSLIRNAAALNTNQTTEITPLLSQIAVPTLIVWGEDDIFQPIEYGQRLAWDIPGAKFVRIPQARHFVALEQPLAVAEHLSAFLKG
jgi:pimeloyl-ACP methyl ester carboxylesterase